MIDLLKKVVLTGIGVASLTTEKIEEISKELISKGEMSEQEGQKFLREMLEKAEDSKVALKKQTEELVNSALGKAQLARAEDISLLKDEVARLRAEISSLHAAEKKNEEGGSQDSVS